MGGEVEFYEEDRPEEPVAPQRRERSTIEFPYSDITAAAQLTRVLYERGGGNASPKQLAGWMDQSPTGGTFRTRLSAARLFGFVETERNQVTITALGRDAIDERNNQSAFVTAFENVPLFSRMYDKHEGYALPPPPAIERQMVEMGVSPKQGDRARQTFVSSASAAGYIDAQSNRLIRPKLDNVSQAPSIEPKISELTTSVRKIAREFHPFIQGLLETLPDADKFLGWEIDDQAEWLMAATGIFKLLSKVKGRITIQVNSEKTAATDQ